MPQFMPDSTLPSPSSLMNPAPESKPALVNGSFPKTNPRFDHELQKDKIWAATQDRTSIGRRGIRRSPLRAWAFYRGDATVSLPTHDQVAAACRLGTSRVPPRSAPAPHRAGFPPRWPYTAIPLQLINLQLFASSPHGLETMSTYPKNDDNDPEPRGGVGGASAVRNARPRIKTRFGTGSFPKCARRFKK